MPIISPKI